MAEISYSKAFNNRLLTRIELTNELRGDLGELCFKHLCKKRSYAYIRLEDIFNSLTPNGILKFKFGYERIRVSVPEDLEDEIRRVCKPTFGGGDGRFVFDFLTCKLSKDDIHGELNKKSLKDFCWVEIKTGGSNLSAHQEAVQKTCKIRFALFRIENVNVSPNQIQIHWEFDSADWK